MVVDLVSNPPSASLEQMLIYIPIKDNTLRGLVKYAVQDLLGILYGCSRHYQAPNKLPLLMLQNKK